jgi:hypothetical protein
MLKMLKIKMKMVQGILEVIESLEINPIRKVS